ncbi:MAG TPA: SgcJ/EcaC family oxidoreductase [Vicinamibacterales bacterium]|nr:SgcJ/EcaC family oxidoreductase [Vicinamibacterales bacterium]
MISIPKFGVVLAGIALAGTTAVLSAQSPAADVAKVRNGYVTAAHAGDAKAVAALFTEDGSEMPPNHATLKGRAAIEKYNQGFLSANSVKLVLTPIETMGAGDIAYDVGSYSQTITPKQAGAKPMTDRGKYVVVLRRDTSGQWNMKFAIYNSDLPPPPMPAAGPAK